MSQRCSTEFLIADPDTFKLACHVMACIAIPIHLYGTWCILMKSSSTMRSAKMLLLWSHCLCALLDLSMSYISIPFVLLPTFSGYPLGQLNMPELQIYIEVTLAALVSTAILSIYENRYYILFGQNKNWSRIRKYFLALNYFLAVAFIAPNYLFCPEQVHAVEVISKRLPCEPEHSIDNRPLFVAAIDINFTFYSITFETSLLFIEVATFFFIVSAKLLFRPNRKISLMSSRTHSLQTKFVIALCIQNVHIFNCGLLYFSLSRPFGTSVKFLNFLLVFYAWFYALTISFLAVLFIYRYWAVFDQQKMKLFRGSYLIIWVIYCSFFGIQFSFGTFYCLEFDDVSFNYFKNEVQVRYNASLNEIPAMAMVAFDPKNGSLRWKNIIAFINILLVLILQYIIMIFCGVKMHLEMEQKIKYFSPIHKQHHQQFFKTLIIQISAPTITLFAPLVFIICLPFFNFDVDMPLGFLLCGFTIYPAIDAIIVMYVVSDYRKVAMSLWVSFLKKIKRTPTMKYEMSLNRMATAKVSSENTLNKFEIN